MYNSHENIIKPLNYICKSICNAHLKPSEITAYFTENHSRLKFYS